MDRITGRSDDMMIIRGVNVFPSQIEEQILKIEQLSPHYQLELIRKGNLDHLVVLLEAKDNIYLDQREVIIKRLQHQIKSMIGISTTVELLPVDSIPRSEGKAQRVRDLRPKSLS
ncbi:hypothetical protein ACXHQN_09410 [Vibrio cincinnatiensis]